MAQQQSGFGEVEPVPGRLESGDSGLDLLVCLGEQPRRQEQLGPVDRECGRAKVPFAEEACRLVVTAQGGGHVSSERRHVAEVVQHLGGGDLAVKRVVKAKSLVEVGLRKAELVAISVKDPAIGKQSRLIEAVSCPPQQGKGAPAFLQSLVEAPSADVNEGMLHKNLPAQLSRGLRARALQLRERGLSLPTLQQHEDQAQTRLDCAGVETPRLGDGDRAAQVAPGRAQTPRLPSDEADRTLGDRGGLGLDAVIGEDFERGRLCLQGVVGDRGKGAFGGLE